MSRDPRVVIVPGLDRPRHPVGSAAAAGTGHAARRGRPDAYRRFIGERLAPGAPVFVVDDASDWPVTRVGSGTCSHSAAAAG